MLKMAKKQYIRHLYEEEGKSIREIARMAECNFRTARKYAMKEDWNEEREPETRVESYPVLKDYIGTIDEWLEADQKVPRKQRHTAKRVYDRLREEKGYTGSYDSVKRYVRKKKQLMKTVTEGYVPLAQPEGHAQADFGEFQYHDGEGDERKGYALTVTFPYSNNGYTQVFRSQNQECLLEGLKRVFEHIGGVPKRIRFDNLSPAVAQVKKGTERVLTDGFIRFQLHYRFQADFCNPAKGNEKGNVENKVGYSRRNALVPVPVITDFAAFNEGLWEWSRKDAERTHYRHQVPIRELWEQERSELLKLPQNPYRVFRYDTLVVNKYGFVVIETNKYGLPPVLSGEKVQAKIWYDHVEFFYDRYMVGRYERSYGRSEELMDLRRHVVCEAWRGGTYPLLPADAGAVADASERLARHGSPERPGTAQRDGPGRERRPVRRRAGTGRGERAHRRGQHPSVLLHDRQKGVPARSAETPRRCPRHELQSEPHGLRQPDGRWHECLRSNRPCGS